MAYNTFFFLSLWIHVFPSMNATEKVSGHDAHFRMFVN